MRRHAVVYAITIGLSIVAVAGLLRIGDSLLPEAPTAPSGTNAGETSRPIEHVVDNARDSLVRLLVQLLLIVGVARVCARIAAALGQPPVIGEIAAGIIIGPSVLGAVAPSATAALFPAESLPILQMLSQVGVLLFMFVIGVELDASHLRGRTHTAIAVGHFGIAVPFVLGVLLALLIYRAYAPVNVPFHAFALFLGVAMSITAFPVLARILEERQLTGTPLGTTALTSAAVGDVTAWSLLAFVSAVVTSAGAAVTLATMVTLSVGFVLVMIYVARPLLARLLDSTLRADALSKEHVALVLGVLLLSALATESIGIHALFGAFLAGVVMPADATFRRLMRERLETIGSVLLLPLFFAYTGLRTEVGLLSDASDWLLCLGVIIVATIGKMGGTIAAARWTGLAWHESFALGALMNTRGLMELIALNVGYDLGILTPEVFTMMVLMALVTTAMTGPLLSLVERRQRMRLADVRWSTTQSSASASSVQRGLQLEYQPRKRVPEGDLIFVERLHSAGGPSHSPRIEEIGPYLPAERVLEGDVYALESETAGWLCFRLVSQLDRQDAVAWSRETKILTGPSWFFDTVADRRGYDAGHCLPHVDFRKWNGRKRSRLWVGGRNGCWRR